MEKEILESIQKVLIVIAILAISGRFTDFFRNLILKMLANAPSPQSSIFDKINREFKLLQEEALKNSKFPKK